MSPTSPGPARNKGAGAAWGLATSAISLAFLFTAARAVLGCLLAPLVVPAMAPGRGEGTAQQVGLRSQAVDLTRIMMLSPILFAASGMFMGILNARHHFLFPAIAPMVYNVAIIVGAVAFDDVRALAIAVVVGAALHLAVQVPALLAVGMRFRPIADWRDRAVQDVARLMGPRGRGLAALQFNLSIAVCFACSVSE